MAKVRKAVITAAGLGTRHFPATQTFQKEMMPLVDRDGATKPTIQIILEEALESGIEEFCLVISPHTEEQFRGHFRGLLPEQAAHFRSKVWALEEAENLQDLAGRITYVVQEQQEGYGHAVYQARSFVGQDPFLLLLGDHVFISGAKQPCSRQVMDVYAEHEAPVSGVQRTHEDLLHLFGTLTGKRVSSNPDTYEVQRIVEKPSLDYAEEHLRTQGLRRGEYLCFFGMHVLPPVLFELLEHHIRRDLRERGEIQLTSSLEMLRERDRYLATEVDGARYDMGVPFGYIQTQLALALNSPPPKQVMSCLPHLLTLSDLENLR
ncbi:MAG: UTP--glucose-1-phosphate uridylyltransferase [Actinomycetota bacterium]